MRQRVPFSPTSWEQSSGLGGSAPLSTGCSQEARCLEEESWVICDDCHSFLQIMTHLPSLINIFLKCSFHTFFFMFSSPTCFPGLESFPLRKNKNVIWWWRVLFVFGGGTGSCLEGCSGAAAGTAWPRSWVLAELLPELLPPCSLAGASEHRGGVKSWEWASHWLQALFQPSNYLLSWHYNLDYNTNISRSSNDAITLPGLLTFWLWRFKLSFETLVSPPFIWSSRQHPRLPE